MSSAILYVAIVAIWACVLIPRWLRRDSVRGAVSTVGTAVPGEAGFSSPADAGVLGVGPGGSGEGAVGIVAPVAPVAPVGVVGPESAVQSAGATDTRGTPGPAPEPMTAEDSRRRMLAARRRLLIMLGVLEAAAVALAVLGLAAMWVVAPPSVMLAGYLLLLREASHADAERAQLEADARARALARARQRAQAARRATAGTASVGTAVAADAAALAARLAAAPVPADYEDSRPGRDFAPGLAGKYTPSHADPAPADDDYDGYEYLRLRAVGD
jgi:hypothetical protein